MRGEAVAIDNGVDHARSGLDRRHQLRIADRAATCLLDARHVRFELMDLVGVLGLGQTHDVGAASDRGLQILWPELRVQRH